MPQSEKKRDEGILISLFEILSDTGYTDLFCPERLSLDTLFLGARFYGIGRDVSTEYTTKALALIAKTPMILICKNQDHSGIVSEGTREKLLLAAMRLYARQGIHEVSLRAIGTAAGSRNSAAAHYHFKNKAGVLDALVAYIFAHINEIGTEQQLYHKAESAVTVEAAIKLCLLPLVEITHRYPWGMDAIRFLSRLMAESRGEYSTIAIAHTRAFYRAADGYLARHLPQLDTQTRQLRMMFMAVNIFHGFAEIASLQHTPLGDLSHIDEERLLNQLTNYLAGGLQVPAPVSTTGDTHERTAL